MNIKLIKDALVVELESYLKQLVNNVETYSYHTFGPEHQESWALTSKDGKCVSSTGLARLIYLIKNVKIDEQRGVEVSAEPCHCLAILRALALYGDRANPEYIDTVTMLTDQCSMGIDRMLNGH